MKRPFFFFPGNILNAKITPGHHLCWWVQRLLMAFYPVAFPFLLAFSLLSGEVVTHPCKRDCHIWICQYDSCLFLFLMTSTCLTLAEGLFLGSVLTSKSLSRRRCELHPFSWGRKELDSLLLESCEPCMPSAWCSQWTHWEQTMIPAEWMMVILFCLCVVWWSQLFRLLKSYFINGGVDFGNKRLRFTGYRHCWAARL